MIQEITIIYYLLLYLFVSLILFSINYASIKLNKILFNHIIKLCDLNHRLSKDNKEEIENLKIKIYLKK